MKLKIMFLIALLSSMFAAAFTRVKSWDTSPITREGDLAQSQQTSLNTTGSNAAIFALNEVSVPRLAVTAASTNWFIAGTRFFASKVKNAKATIGEIGFSPHSALNAQLMTG